MLLLLLLQADTFAGTGKAGFSGDGGPATAAQINNPFGVVRGPDGAIWFCEYDGQRIRRVGKDGVISTVAGSGETGLANGPALKASFNKPHEIRFDAKGDLYVADMANHAIRRIDLKSGTVSTFAGTGKAGYSGDGGPAAEAALKQPHSIQFGPDGDLYICDIGNHVIRRVDKAGRISTYAGTGKAGPTPDGAPIQGTPLNGPRSLDFDRQGRLWLATREGNQVFRFEGGKIHHVAGTGKKGFTGNGGPAREATLSGPKGIAVAPNGDVLLVDTESHSIRKIDAKTGRLELVLGSLARPHGIWIDPDGTIFIGDSENHRIQRLK